MSLADDFRAGQRVLAVAPHTDGRTSGRVGAMARASALGGEGYAASVSVRDLANHEGRAGRSRTRDRHFRCR